MILVIGGEKGGTGKTTIATNIAAMRASEGRDVLLVDTDVQGSASFWAQSRDEAGVTPRVHNVQKFGKGLAHEIKDLARRYQDIVIDAGGRDSLELRAAMVSCDLAIIPVQASQFDLWTLDRMDEIVTTARGFNEGLRVKILISRASTNPVVTEAKDAADLVGDFESFELATSVIRDRIAFRRAASQGRAVAEMVKPDEDRACAEIWALYQEIFDER